MGYTLHDVQKSISERGYYIIKRPSHLTATYMTENQYEFSEKNEVKSEFFSYGKPGNSIVGTIIDRKQVPDDFNPGGLRWKYTLKVKNGSFNKLVDKKPTDEVVTLTPGNLCIVTGKEDVDAGLKAVPNGNVVGIKYILERPSKQDKKKTVKECKVYNFGPDPELNNEITAEDL